MLVRKLLGLEPEENPTHAGDTETVRRIARQLGALAPETARYVAAFAFILSRVAHADAGISPEETLEMERTVVRWGGIPTPQAALVVEIAKAQASLLGATEGPLVARQFKSFSTPPEREALLHCLFAVSAADDSVSSAEEALILEIAAELGVSDQDFIAVRRSYNDKRAVLKGFSRRA
jgi:uncharacterized tellurite resistance protein B-like protein